MQILYKRAVIRALIGGRWEYTARLGWYRMERAEGERTPCTVERTENNEDIALAIRIAGGIGMLTVCLATIAVLQAGWPA